MNVEASSGEPGARRAGPGVGRIAWVALGLSLMPTPVIAQQGDAARIELGDTVRFRIPGALRVDGAFHGWQADVMMIGVDGIDEDWPVSVFDVASLDLYTDRTRREGLRHFAMLGTVTGLFIGAGIGLGLHTLGVIDDPGGPPQEIMSNTLDWAGVGAVAGVISGAFYGSRRPGRGWVQIRLPRG